MPAMPASTEAPTAVSPTPTANSASTPAFSPLYQQIKLLLAKSLQAGEWQPGQAIPSEMELAARYSVSQGTVRKAIDEMATENRLVRRQGKGTFVASHAEQATQYRFLRLVADDGSAPALHRRLLDCRRMRAPANVQAALQLKPGDVAVQVRRLLLDADKPVVLDDLWLPGTPFKRLTAEKLSQWQGPLYRLFEAEFAVHMIRADERLRAVGASAEDAALLEVAAGTPLLSVERIAYSWGEQPVELRRGLYRTERHYYRNALN
jgi:GntR family transcriptional regulator